MPEICEPISTVVTGSTVPVATMGRVMTPAVTDAVVTLTCGLV